MKNTESCKRNKFGILIILCVLTMLGVATVLIISLYRSSDENQSMNTEGNSAVETQNSFSRIRDVTNLK